MTVTLERQVSFVDKSEFGLIDQDSTRLAFLKFSQLGKNSKERIVFGMTSKYGFYSNDLQQIMDGHKTFTPEQFLDFCFAIEYYQDFEKHQPV